MPQSAPWKAIAAMSENRVIGNGNEIPWRISEDFKWFKATTMGGVLVMGRKTWESLPKALPGRENWVLSKTMQAVEGVRVFRSLEDALEALGERVLFIIGGGQLYAATLLRCQELFLTEVHLRIEGGDAFFPEHAEAFEPVETLHECEEFTLRRWTRKNHP